MYVTTGGRLGAGRAEHPHRSRHGSRPYPARCTVPGWRWPVPPAAAARAAPRALCILVFFSVASIPSLFATGRWTRAINSSADHGGARNTRVTGRFALATNLPVSFAVM